MSVPGRSAERVAAASGGASVPGEEGGVQKAGVEPPASSSSGSGVEGSDPHSWPTWQKIKR
jgi:hypothetical protein